MKCVKNGHTCKIERQTFPKLHILPQHKYHKIQGNDVFSRYYVFSTHLQDTFYSHLLVANSLIASSYDNSFIMLLFPQRGKEDNCFIDWSVFLLLLMFVLQKAHSFTQVPAVCCSAADFCPKPSRLPVNFIYYASCVKGDHVAPKVTIHKIFLLHLC